jgi:hypothetical protein
LNAIKRFAKQLAAHSSRGLCPFLLNRNGSIHGSFAVFDGCVCNLGKNLARCWVKHVDCVAALTIDPLAVDI